MRRTAGRTRAQAPVYSLCGPVHREDRDEHEHKPHADTNHQHHAPLSEFAGTIQITRALCTDGGDRKSEAVHNVSNDERQHGKAEHDADRYTTR